jgi:metallophosphoesterase superfamily enzyme
MRVDADWLLTASRAAVHLPTATAVVADLHVGYGLARCRSGEAVPASGLDDTVAALKAVLDGGAVRRLVIAGDLVENRAGLALVPELLEWLAAGGVEVAGIVPGNHDRGMKRDGLDFPLRIRGVRLGRWRVVHGDGDLPSGRLVLGHFHPCVRWRGGPSAPCFLLAPDRIMLPALSADAAGVNVRGDARWRGYRCCVVAGDEVLDFGVLGGAAARPGKRQRAEGSG